MTEVGQDLVAGIDWREKKTKEKKTNRNTVSRHFSWWTSCPPLLSLLQLSGCVLLFVTWDKVEKCHKMPRLLFSLLPSSDSASLSPSLPEESVCDLWPVAEIGGEHFFCQVGDLQSINVLAPLASGKENSNMMFYRSRVAALKTLFIIIHVCLTILRNNTCRLKHQRNIRLFHHQLHVCVANSPPFQNKMKEKWK